MQIWPAIDLRGGKCVRLEQGDYGRETVFGDDPAAMARHLVEAGAECLHLVDLDGARDGKPVNLAEHSGDSSRRSTCRANWAAAFATRRRSATLLDDLGLARLVIGTQALREPDWFRHMVQRFPGKLALGIDARDGMVATDGWLETSIDAGDRPGQAVRRRAAGRDHLHRHRPRRHAGRAEPRGDARRCGRRSACR